MLRSYLRAEEMAEKAFPTTLRMPVWARPLIAKRAASRIRIADATVKRISDVFDLERGLLRSPLAPHLRPALDPGNILSVIQTEAPVDGTEIVGWMQISAVDNIVMQARILEYNRAGSQIVGNSGDPWIPGVAVEDVRFVRKTGGDVESDGFAVVTTPRGNFDVPSLGKRPGVFRDLISWGSNDWLGKAQWTGNLLKWKDLLETPIRDVVGFFRDNRGNVAPHFFVQMPPRPSLTALVRQVFSSDRDQTIGINFRDPTDYSRIVGSRDVAIVAGTTEVSFTVSAFPYVPPLVVEIQPQDATQTKLEEYVVY
jgi:hypothetical protein